MQVRKPVLILFSALILSSALFAAETFTIDPVHSSVAFSVKHMVVSNVHGIFRDVSGTLNYDSKDVTKSSVEVHIKTASIDTGSDNRDKHLRSPDFFDVEKYPEMTFKSTSIEKSGESFVARGPLTIHGVSKDVAIPFTVAGTIKDPRGGMRFGAEASLTINRKDFGLSWNRAIEGGMLVGDDVKIDLGVEGKQEAAEASKQ
jgi:polyisoprenoid-binding protein YceI